MAEPRGFLGRLLPRIFGLGPELRPEDAHADTSAGPHGYAGPPAYRATLTDSHAAAYAYGARLPDSYLDAAARYAHADTHGDADARKPADAGELPGRLRDLEGRNPLRGKRAGTLYGLGPDGMRHAGGDVPLRARPEGPHAHAYQVRP